MVAILIFLFSYLLFPTWLHKFDDMIFSKSDTFFMTSAMFRQKTFLWSSVRLIRRAYTLMTLIVLAFGTDLTAITESFFIYHFRQLYLQRFIWYYSQFNYFIGFYLTFYTYYQYLLLYLLHMRNINFPFFE